MQAAEAFYQWLVAFIRKSGCLTDSQPFDSARLGNQRHQKSPLIQHDKALESLTLHTVNASHISQLLYVPQEISGTHEIH